MKTEMNDEIETKLSILAAAVLTGKLGYSDIRPMIEIAFPALSSESLWSVVCEKAIRMQSAA